MMRALVASLLLAASAVAQEVGRVRAMTVTEDDLVFKDAMVCTVTECVPPARAAEETDAGVAPVAVAVAEAGVGSALTCVATAEAAGRKRRVLMRLTWSPPGN